MCCRRVSVCPSAVPPVTSRYCIETTWQIELAFSMKAFFPPVPHCIIRKFGYMQKWGYFPLELGPKTLDFENFATVKSIALSTKLVDDRTCWRHGHLYVSRRVVAVYYTSISCNNLTRLLWFVVDLLYNLFLQLWSSWQDFHWHSVSRGPSAVAEFLAKVAFWFK